MRLAGLSGSSEVARRAGVPPTSPSWPRAWRVLVGWPARTPVGHDPTGSIGRQLTPGTGVGGTSTAPGPGGGAAYPSAHPAGARRFGKFAHAQPAASRGQVLRPASHPDCHTAQPRPRDCPGRHPGRDTPDPASSPQRAATSSARPAPATDHPGPGGAAAPHTRTDPDARLANRGTARGAGMNHNGSPPHHLAHSDGTTGVVAANAQWHDADLALKVARHSYDRWLVDGRTTRRRGAAPGGPTTDKQVVPSLASPWSHARGKTRSQVVPYSWQTTPPRWSIG
jgi:hypothetical protein